MEMNRRYSIWRDGDKHKDMEGGGAARGYNKFIDGSFRTFLNFSLSGGCDLRLIWHLR